MDDQLPEFPFDPTPRRDLCEKCGADNDLRFVIVRGRTRYFGRTLCDTCTEAVLELLLETEPDVSIH
jgi:superfamily II helicase